MMNRRELLWTAGMLPAIVPLASRPGGAQQRPRPKSEFDYVDWSWARWRKITGSTRPSLKTPQSGQAELLDLAQPDRGTECATMGGSAPVDRFDPGDISRQARLGVGAPSSRNCGGD